MAKCPSLQDLDNAIHSFQSLTDLETMSMKSLRYKNDLKIPYRALLSKQYHRKSPLDAIIRWYTKKP